MKMFCLNITTLVCFWHRKNNFIDVSGFTHNEVYKFLMFLDIFQINCMLCGLCGVFLCVFVCVLLVYTSLGQNRTGQKF